MFNYHICCENVAKYSRVKRQTEAKVLGLFFVRTEQSASKEECIKRSKCILSVFQEVKEDLKNSISKSRRALNFLINVSFS